jgi:Tol biopolymer transport system component
LYVHDGALLAQGFDVDTLRLTGEPIRVAEDLDYYRSTGSAAFSASSRVLAYQGDAGSLEVVWFGRDGSQLGSIWEPRRFGNLRISPDGAQAAMEVVDPHQGTSDIWMYHFGRRAATRFTTDFNDETMPLWSADGGRIIFGSDRGVGKDASSDFFTKTSDGMGPEDELYAQVGFQTPDDWSRNGKSLAYTDSNQQTGNDLWILSLVGERTARPILKTRFNEWGARFSPDSQWLAYVSDESGRSEISIIPSEGPGAKVPVSVGGGLAPRWRADGRELFYVTADGKAIMTVPIDFKPTLRVGVPARLFAITRETGFRNRARNLSYDVSPDGQRFLMSVAAGERVSSRITVIQNWATQLDK